MTEQELLLTLEERATVYQELNELLPRHIVTASPEMRENKLSYAQIEKVLNALPRLAREAGYVKLADDQSLPALTPSLDKKGKRCCIQDKPRTAS